MELEYQMRYVSYQRLSVFLEYYSSYILFAKELYQIEDGILMFKQFIHTSNFRPSNVWATKY